MNAMCSEPQTDTLLGYLYGELPPAERRAFEGHLAACEPCRVEVAALRGVRDDLLAWAPPECRDLPSSWAAAPVAVAPSGFVRTWLPAVGLAAAAMLVSAVAASVAQLDIRYGPDGLVIRTGGAPAATATQVAATPAAASTPFAPTHAAAPVVTAADLAALESRLRASFDAASSSAPMQRVSLSSTNPRLTSDVRRLIEESEERTRREMADRFLQIVTDFEGHRRSDMLRVQQVLGQVQRSTGADIAQQREALNRLMLVSQTQGQPPR